MDTRSADNTLLEKTSPAASRVILFQPRARRSDPRANDENRRLRDFVAEHTLARITLIIDSLRHHAREGGDEIPNEKP